MEREKGEGEKGGGRKNVRKDGAEIGVDGIGEP